MVSLASRYRMPTSIRKYRPLTNDELQLIVPSAFSSDIVGQVIEGAYTVLKIFDAVDENIDLMKSIQLTLPEQRLFGATALELKYDGKPAPITPEQIINPRRVLDRGQDLWTTFNVVQENVIRGGIRGRTEKGKMTRTREVTGIDGDIKLNQVLWKMAEEFAKLKA